MAVSLPQEIFVLSAVQHEIIVSCRPYIVLISSSGFVGYTCDVSFYDDVGKARRDHLVINVTAVCHGLFVVPDQSVCFYKLRISLSQDAIGNVDLEKYSDDRSALAVMAAISSYKTNKPFKIFLVDATYV